MSSTEDAQMQVYFQILPCSHRHTGILAYEENLSLNL